jgi:hypothetical protein
MPAALDLDRLAVAQTAAQCQPTRTRSLTFFATRASTIVAKLTSELAARRNGKVSASLLDAQLPTWLHAVAWTVYGPLRPASGIVAISCPLLVKLVGRLVQLLLPCGAILISPLATCDSLSLASTTT